MTWLRNEPNGKMGIFPNEPNGEMSRLQGLSGRTMWLRNEPNGKMGVFPNEPIYERGEVKRAGAEIWRREPPHIPLAVGVGRSGPSQTPPTVPGSCTPDTHPLSPRPRERSPQASSNTTSRWPT